MASNFLIRIKETGAKATKKSISALTSSMGSLARAGKTAALGTAAIGAAAVVAGGKAVKMAGEFDQLSSAFNSLNKSSGFGAGSLDKYRKALNGTVSSAEMMKMANNAMLLGIADSNDQMAKMFDVAQRLGAAVGEDAAFGVNSLVTGMGRQSILMLDNLGIMVDTEVAHKRFAEANKINVKDLTEVQKKQAFNNETMRQAEILIGDTGEEVETTSMKMAKMKAQMIDGSVAIGQKLAPAFDRALDVISEFGGKAGGIVMKAFELDFASTGTNIMTNMGALGKSLVDSWAVLFDSDAMINVLSGIKTGFLWVMQQVFSIVKNVGSFLFEPVLVGGKIIAIKTVNFFIEKFNDLKAELNSLVDKLPQKIKDKLGFKGFKPTIPFSLEGLDTAKTKMAEFLATLGDDQTNSNQDVAEKLAAIWTEYGNSVVATNEKIEESHKSTTGVATGEGDIVIAKQVEYSEQLSSSLSSISGMTTAINERASAEMAQLKSSAKFKNASQKEQEAMESALLKKQAAEKTRIAKTEKTSKLASATMNTYEAVTKAWAQTGIFGTISAGIALAAGLAQVNAIASTPIPSFAQGGDFVTNGSQMIMVGDNPSGREHVKIEPLDAGGEPTGGGSAVNITFNSPVMSADHTEDVIIPQIKEAIRRGADIGVS